MKPVWSRTHLRLRPPPVAQRPRLRQDWRRQKDQKCLNRKLYKTSDTILLICLKAAIIWYIVYILCHIKCLIQSRQAAKSLQNLHSADRCWGRKLHQQIYRGAFMILTHECCDHHERGRRNSGAPQDTPAGRKQREHVESNRRQKILAFFPIFVEEYLHRLSVWINQKEEIECYPEHRATTMKMVKMKSRRAVMVNPETQTRIRETPKHDDHNENNTQEVKYHCSCTSINQRLESLTCVLRWRLAAAAAGVEGRGGRDFREAAQWLGELLLWLTDLRTNLLLDEQLPGRGHYVLSGRGHFVRRGRDLSVVWKWNINKVRTGRRLTG